VVRGGKTVTPEDTRAAPFDFESFFGNDHPYIIFGAYAYLGMWYGMMKYDNFMVFDN
jgi:hypothetical protein